MSMSEQELKDILDRHGKWLRNEPGGERADLRDANLNGADLRDADLNGADLSDANLNYANLRYADLSGVNLRRTDMSYAHLNYADLSGATLRDAVLRGADLSDADLTRANLRCADLSDADLNGADLSDADLSGAHLVDANLNGADLSYANLRDAYLRDAHLRDANLRDIKYDLFDRLMIAKNEVAGLYDHLMRGKIEGNAYKGECACFVGTIANVAGQNYKELSSGLKPDANGLTEKWFLSIREGDVPQSNHVADITREWIEEFAKKNDIKLGRY